MTADDQSGLEPAKPKKWNGAKIGIASAGLLVLGIFFLAWALSYSSCAHALLFFWMLVAIDVSSLIAAIVAIRNHSWWWISVVLLDLFFMTQVLGAFVDC